jgi:hypothetical protein
MVQLFQRMPSMRVGPERGLGDAATSDQLKDEHSLMNIVRPNNELKQTRAAMVRTPRPSLLNSVLGGRREG